MVANVGNNKNCQNAKQSEDLASESGTKEVPLPKSVPRSQGNPSSVTKNKLTRLYINTGVPGAGKVGLRINSSWHVRHRSHVTYKDNIFLGLIFLLSFYVLYLHVQSQQLLTEVKVAQKQLQILEHTLESMNILVGKVQGRLNELQHSQPTELAKEHTIDKRDADPNLTYTNCTSTTAVVNERQARSVNRGPYSVHLRGALPEIIVRDGGLIAPWYIDTASSGEFLLVDGVVGEGRGILEIVEEGLYFIYAQVYYLTSSALNSYVINVQVGEGRWREDSVVATCSAEAASSRLSELSCFTAVVRYLHRGDKVYLSQRERNRRIIFRDNKSFFGFTLLNSFHGSTQ